MDSDAPVGANRRGFRRWRWWIALLLVSPVILVLAGNLFLSSPWSRRWIAAKIERVTGMEARVGGASWSPWNGPSIRRIELLQPGPLRDSLKEPLMRIREARIVPVWPAWLRGRFEIRAVHLDSPRLVLPVELLSQLSKSSSPVQPAPAAPPVAAVTPVPPPAVIPAPPPVTSVPPTSPPPPAVKPPPRPTGWLYLKNASFALVHAGSKRTYFEINKTRGAIPISGDQAGSALEIGSVSAFGNVLSSNLPANLDWTPPLLSLKPLQTKIAGYQIVIAAKIAAFNGLPLQIEAQLPQQEPPPFPLPGEGKASAKSIAANFRFRGLLLAPGSWQGDLVVEADSPKFKISEHDAAFDRGSAVSLLRGGVLSCVDARLIGDELSLLGNATLLADGRCAAAARLTASPDSLNSIASWAFPDLKGAPSLTPLSTPQRAAFDLEAAGNITRLFLRLGKDGPVVNLKP